MKTLRYEIERIVEDLTVNWKAAQEMQAQFKAQGFEMSEATAQMEAIVCAGTAQKLQSALNRTKGGAE